MVIFLQNAMKNIGQGKIKLKLDAQKKLIKMTFNLFLCNFPKYFQLKQKKKVCIAV